MRKGTPGFKRWQRANRPPEGEPWVWLTREMVESPAWCALSAPALRVLMRIMVEHMHHGGTENGGLACTYDQFAAYGVSRKAINGAIEQAHTLGFLDVIERGHRGYGIARRPSLYALTWLPRADGSPPTNRWKRIFPSTQKGTRAVPKRAFSRCPKGN